ncbi:hypothetical protein DAPPUDRAFT_241615 [Daphnia pulex]|uniref:Uncharacterized protein n=1 Tax=Daphnia pulex TaxID=6669 RepID=E9GEN5_DAPPU|nr:hypothetical protein DAPPUDRAFT_241615 [Daphnia pulex]|eukprot:EFX82048.1 hypothetical protein DAPPUDRAFT_241615 [Daphnia pulex]
MLNNGHSPTRFKARRVRQAREKPSHHMRQARLLYVRRNGQRPARSRTLYYTAPASLTQLSSSRQSPAMAP